MATNIITSYIPSQHGFHFANEFRNLVMSLPPGDISTFGRCNGMSWVSLDYFNAGRHAPAIADVDLGLPLHAGLAAAFNGTVTQLFGMRDFAGHAATGGDRPVGRTLTASGSSRNWGKVADGIGHDAPAAVCWAPNRTDLFMRGTDSEIVHCWFDGILADQRQDFCNDLPGFEPMGLHSNFGPAVASPYANRLELYAVDPSGDLQFNYFEGGWQGWGSLGHPEGLTLTSGPAAVAQYGFMSAFVRASDGGCWQMVWNNGWQPWAPVGAGGIFTSGFAAASSGPGHVEVYGRRTDGNLWLIVFENNRWGNWRQLQSPSAPPVGLTEDSPAAILTPGLRDVFARGNDGNVWHRKFTPLTTQNVNIPGPFGLRGGSQITLVPENWARVADVFTPAAQQLANAIYIKNLSSTVNPIIGAAIGIFATFPFGLVALAGLDAWRNYISWNFLATDQQCINWSSTDELRKLITLLQQGRPIPLGLIGYTGFGHEVVAFGLTSIADPTTDPLPGGASWSIKVYDPNHPGCDNVTITIDPNSTATYDGGRVNKVRSSTGEMWRGCFVRDDYRPQPPPV